MPPVSAYPVQLGRIKLPALIAPKDTYGDGLEAVGAVLVAAERKPRPLELELHLYGNAAEADPKLVGDRLRRQLQGLLENARARLQGLWLTFEADPMLDSFLLLGGGELAIDDPSLVLGDFALSLTDVYRVAKAQTHREARRLDLSDLRLATTPRDFKRARYGTSWATFTKAAPPIALPSGVTDVALGADLRPSAGARPSLHGPDVPLVRTDFLPVNGINGAVLSFERAAASRGPSDVIAWDRRGILPSGAPSVAGAGGSAPAGVAVPAYSAAGDRDPAGVYGWEEVYGPAHPLYNPLDPPVLENGVARVRYVATDSAGFGGLLLETYSGGAGGYVPVSLIQLVAGAGFLGTILNAALVEWTPERAVVRLSVKGSTSAASSARAEVYVTLERGWTGPKLELYLSGGPQGTPAPPAAGFAANGLKRYAGTGPSSHPLGDGSITVVPRSPNATAGVAAATDETAGGTIDLGVPADAEPWVYWMPTGAAAGGYGLAIAPLEPPAKVTVAYGIFAYVGGPGGFFDALRVTAPAPAGANTGSYIGARFGVGPVGVMLEAEAYRNTASGTTAVAADAAATGGQAVSDSQSAASPSGAVNTVVLTAAQVTALGLAPGVYRLLARVRIANAGAIVAAVRPDLDASITTWTSASYGWVDLGDVRPGNNTIAAKVYRASGTGIVYVDRLALVPAELFSPAADLVGTETGTRNGGRELAAETVSQIRATPTVVSR